MIVVAFAHEGSVALARSDRLEARIASAYDDHVPGVDRIRWVWLDLPPGSAYVAGRPSTLSTVLATVPDGLSESRREAFMRAVSQHWADETGCSVKEVMVTAADASMLRQYLAASRSRFAPVAIPGLALRVGFDVLRRRLRGQPLGTSIDLPAPTKW